MATIYKYYAAKKSLRFEEIASEYGHVCLQVSGIGVWEAFKNEIGKHQVQRIPPNEKHDRRQTSIVAVGVMKIFNFQGKPLRDQDLEIKCQTGSGPGGQNQNNVHSAVRMKHIPTGLSVFITGRDQGQNKSKAREILTSRVNDLLYEQAHCAHAAARKDQIGDAGRTGKIRTYNFFKNIVHDHRTSKKTTNIKEIMKGNLDILF